MRSRAILDGALEPTPESRTRRTTTPHTRRPTAASAECTTSDPSTAPAAPTAEDLQRDAGPVLVGRHADEPGLAEVQRERVVVATPFEQASERGRPRPARAARRAAPRSMPRPHRRRETATSASRPRRARAVTVYGRTRGASDRVGGTTTAAAPAAATAAETQPTASAGSVTTHRPEAARRRTPAAPRARARGG